MMLDKVLSLVVFFLTEPTKSDVPVRSACEDAGVHFSLVLTRLTEVARQCRQWCDDNDRPTADFEFEGHSLFSVVSVLYFSTYFDLQQSIEFDPCEAHIKISEIEVKVPVRVSLDRFELITCEVTDWDSSEDLQPNQITIVDGDLLCNGEFNADADTGMEIWEAGPLNYRTAFGNQVFAAVSELLQSKGPWVATGC